MDNLKIVRIELEDFKGATVEKFNKLADFNQARKNDFEKYQELYDYYIVEFNGVRFELTPNQLKGGETTDNNELDKAIERTSLL